MILTYDDALKLIEDFNKNHCDSSARVSGSITNYDAYIEGEYHNLHPDFAEIEINIMYYRDYPTDTYYCRKSSKDLSKRIHSIEFCIRPHYDNPEYKKYYTEDEEVLNAIYPLIIDEIKRVKTTFHAEQKEKDTAEKEERRKKYLELKQEFEQEN